MWLGAYIHEHFDSNVSMYRPKYPVYYSHKLVCACYRGDDLSKSWTQLRSMISLMTTSILWSLSCKVIWLYVSWIQHGCLVLDTSCILLSKVGVFIITNARFLWSVNHARIRRQVFEITIQVHSCVTTPWPEYCIHHWLCPQIDKVPKSSQYSQGGNTTRVKTKERP